MNIIVTEGIDEWELAMRDFTEIELDKATERWENIQKLDEENTKREEAIKFEEDYLKFATERWQKIQKLDEKYTKLEAASKFEEDYLNFVESHLDNNSSLVNAILNEIPKFLKKRFFDVT